MVKRNKKEARLYKAKGRMTFMIVGMVLAYSVIALRLFDLTVLRALAKPEEAQATSTKHPQALRGEILDRNGVLLATSLKTASLYADPKFVTDAEKIADDLIKIMPHLKRDQLVKKLSEGGKRFVWLERNITPKQQYEINALGYPALDFKFEDRRIYPLHSLTAHVVGYADVDGQGIAGIEKKFNQQLKDGESPVVLTLDTRVQYILRKQISEIVKEFSAVAGAGIIMDIENGDILAMVSYPDFDPHHPSRASEDQLFNRASLGVYEMGSTFKLFSTAAALDHGQVTMASRFDTRAPIKIGRFTINDFRGKNRVLSLPEVFIYSSNIGTAKMALTVGGEGLKDFYKRLGFDRSIVFDLPEVGKPLFPQKRWGDLVTITTSFGHGVAVTPLHVVQATAALMNGGKLIAPRLLYRQDAQPEILAEDLVTAQTAQDIKTLMTLTTAKGTGSKALVKGYDVGGKTGTAEKVSNRGYIKSSLLSSFVGVFPMQTPKYVAIVIIDEPKPTKKSAGYATGGWTAAPVIGRTIAEMAPVLALYPYGDHHTEEVVAKMKDYLYEEAKKNASE